MPQLSLESQVAKDATYVIDRIVDGETLLIDQKSGEFFSLNAVATEIWASLDGSKSVGDLAAMIADNYEVEPMIAQKDVLELVGDLVDEGLVTIVE
ncbi:MAG: PqqD family protein [Chloroflexota bacterium]|nr:PqqD family protein [Chloroflexota bacterium]